MTGDLLLVKRMKLLVVKEECLNALIVYMWNVGRRQTVNVPKGATLRYLYMQEEYELRVRYRAVESGDRM